jgi:hypothetical protein
MVEMNENLIISDACFQRGVTKTIVAAARTIIDSDGSEQLLHPPDPRPLSPEEEQAVVLMSSFCPKPSTPDTKVGTVLAQGRI